MPHQPPVTVATPEFNVGSEQSLRIRAIQALIRSSAWNYGDMRGWFQLILHPPVTFRPAGLQRIREKAAEGIRTLDLLHGNYAGCGRALCLNLPVCR